MPARPVKRATGTLQIVIGVIVLVRAVSGLFDLLRPEPGDPTSGFLVVVTVGSFVLGIGCLVVGCYLKVTRARARDQRAGHRPG
ncbi:hypothetical protein SAMN04489812_1719 [Microlunatus soli]|uniref:Uncharacterized protein n=1 Tax=Microlunatus soli TaxID=630515 RepID=A0A1H1RPF4_9ACTN|nr:hypothetical protein SAMN04489812_1719 [Microlunatus soli]